ncbi:MAG TPA: acyltransferase [Cytophagaceae bacterium]|nr:acyltransferase [Cytophagaceae bacterium]
METTNTPRNYEIDGIRGWAALSVLFYHFFWESYGIKYPMIRTGYFNFILDGTLAVFIFFVLSGDALSNSYFRKGSTYTTVRLVLARYFRLTFLVLLSCLVVYVLMKLSLTFPGGAGKILHREDWLGIFITFSADLYACIQYSLYGVYFKHDVHTSYNPFLWTMSVELLGSLVVFINVFVLPHVKKPFVILLVQFVFFTWMESWLALFLFGMILGYLRAEGVLEKWRQWKYTLVCSFLVVGGVIAYDTMGDEPQETFISYLYMTFFLVGAIYCNVYLVKFFSNRLSRFWGEISFAVYAIHFCVVVSLMSWLTIQEQTPIQQGDPKMLLIPLASCFISIGLGWLCYKFEKLFLEKLNHTVKKWII